LLLHALLLGLDEGQAGGTLPCGLIQLDVFQRHGIEFGFQPGECTFLRAYCFGQHAVHALQRLAALLQAVDSGLQLLAGRAASSCCLRSITPLPLAAL
jgi:hypothetical protein